MSTPSSSLDLALAFKNAQRYMKMPTLIDPNEHPDFYRRPEVMLLYLADLAARTTTFDNKAIGTGSQLVRYTNALASGGGSGRCAPPGTPRLEQMRCWLDECVPCT